MGVRFTAQLNNDSKEFEVLKVTDEDPGTSTEVVASFGTSDEANNYIRQQAADATEAARTPADAKKSAADDKKSAKSHK